MAELLHRAWSGWTGYTDRGKLPALLFAVLLFLWFGRKEKEQKPLMLYTSLTAACCILPVSAAVLMLYQTKFYNYEWIWSLVPLTVVTGYGGTVFWTEYRERNTDSRGKVLMVTLLMLAAVMFCGSLGAVTGEGRDVRQARRRRAYEAVDRLSERLPGVDICLWAPREIMEYARERDARIRLPYGRNFWDAYLDAYAYDVYERDVVLMGQWMENLAAAGEADLMPEGSGAGEPVSTASMVSETEREVLGEKETGAEEEPASGRAVTLEDCVGKALEQGVNCILLPGETAPEILDRMARALGTQPEVLGEYNLFYCESPVTCLRKPRSQNELPCSFCKTAVRQTACSCGLCAITVSPQTFMHGGAVGCMGGYCKEESYE